MFFPERLLLPDTLNRSGSAAVTCFPDVANSLPPGPARIVAGDGFVCAAYAK